MKPNWKQSVVILIAVLALAALAACAQLGLVQPETVPEKIAYAYGTLTQVRTQAAMLLKQKRISLDAAKQIQQLTDVARSGLDKARDLHFSGNGTESSKQLELATSLLREAQDYLAGREKLKPKAEAGRGRS